LFTLIIIPALTLGFLGSFHCVGMCGPIALSLPVGHLSGIRKTLGIISYNLGRVVTYAILGALFGMIGKTFVLFSSQQLLSIILGILLMLMFILMLVGKRIMGNSTWLQQWNRTLSKTMAPLFQHKNPLVLSIIGLLNGLLPCGLVYMAITGAVAFASPWQSAVFMAFFGLGTLPAMMLVSIAGNMIQLSLRNTIRKISPYIIGLMGLLMILRGMNLNIPYFSPSLKQDKMKCCELPDK